MPVWIVRGTNAFGPRQNPEKAIPVFTTAALEGRPLPVYDRGQQSREWLYVTDWAAACVTALHHGEPGDVFNIGDGTELHERWIWPGGSAALAGADESLVTFVADRPGHDLRYGVTSERLHELGWRADGAVRRGPRANGRLVPRSHVWVAAMRAEAVLMRLRP